MRVPSPVPTARCAVALTLLTAGLLCAGTARAGNTTYAGVMCSADGQFERRVNGELWNKNTDISTYTMFNCPLVLNENLNNGATVRARVYVRWNDNTLIPAAFLCALRVTSTNGLDLDYTPINFLSKANAGSEFTSHVGSVTVPASEALPASVHLRCRVPNGSANWGWAGIVAYKVVVD